MSGRVLVVGAGIGGLAAAIRLARRGCEVRVLEAREQSGGLASGVTAGGLRFDGGPYVLLDRPGLEWAFAALGTPLEECVELRHLEDVYEVSSPESPPLRFRAELAATIEGIEALYPGSGRRYGEFVAWARRAYARLEPLLRVPRPDMMDVLRLGAWREAQTLLGTLRSRLARFSFPPLLRDAIAIWTHIAGRPIGEAPAYMALVPALIHGAGAFHPIGGVRAVPEALARIAGELGVSLELGCTVRSIRWHGGRVSGIVTEAGEHLAADAVISNVGIATYVELLDPALPGVVASLARLPLQSPGVCAYLRVRGRPRPPYLRFRLARDGCRLLVAPGVLDDGALEAPPARLMAPLALAPSSEEGTGEQSAYLQGLLAEGWWREGLDGADILATRLSSDWGREFRLFRDAMNPVMTARFARAGRLRHRSPHVRGLYLAGGATHPGQWVSFCAISGILAANCLLEDLN